MPSIKTLALIAAGAFLGIVIHQNLPASIRSAIAPGT